MTEDQYQQLRQFIKYNGKYISIEQLRKLKDVSNDAKNIRNRVFSVKHRVIQATRAYERYDTEKSKSYMEYSLEELKNVKTEFSKFLFDTSANRYDTIKSDRERNEVSEFN